jgi:hypothetical protein
MPRSPDSGQLDLSDVFLKVQQELLAQMAVGGLFEHASAAGTATERHWIDLFNRYLPQRYRSTSAFVIDSSGRRSRQIDIAIFDNLYSPLLFPHSSGLHIAAESVYAVFEVKPTISRQWIRDAGEKAASVRALRRTSVPVIAGGTPRSAIPPMPIIAGLLATSSVWSPETFAGNVESALAALSSHASNDQHLDLGCSLQHGAFEQIPKPHASEPRLSRSGTLNLPPALDLPSEPQRSNVGPPNVGALNVGPPNVGPLNVGPPNVGPLNVGPPNVRALNVGPLNVGPAILPASRLSSRLSSSELRPPGSALSSRTATVKERHGQPAADPRLSSRTATVGKRSTRGPAGNRVSTSTPDESLIFFILRLMERLRAMGTAPAADLMEYGRSLRSFRD